MTPDNPQRHVLHWTNWHPVIDGVSGLFVLEQCSALQAAGTQVGLVCSRIQGLRDFRMNRALLGLPGFFQSNQPVPTLGFKSWHVPGMRPVIAQIQMRMLINRYAAYVRRFGQPDILHGHCALEAGSATRAAALQSALPYVLTEHSSEILNGVEDASRRATAKRVYESAAAVIAVSDRLAGKISELAPAVQPIVIGNMVRDSVFRMARAQRPVTERITIVAISSLVPAKRIDLAINALAGIAPAQSRAIDFVVVGDGPERARLETLAARLSVNCRFMGNLPHAEAMAQLAGAHMLLHPSSFETFGIVLAEAAALGVPVVATRSGGPQSIVHDDSGVLVDVDDLEQIGAAIAAVIDNLPGWECKRPSMIRSCRDRFHESNVVNSIQGVYDRC